MLKHKFKPNTIFLINANYINAKSLHIKPTFEIKFATCLENNFPWSRSITTGAPVYPPAGALKGTWHHTIVTITFSGHPIPRH